jgi:hypothetical protein
MIANIRELNLDDLKNVSGGVAVMTASRVPVSAHANQAMAAPSRPSTTAHASVSIEQLRAGRF